MDNVPCEHPQCNRKFSTNPGMRNHLKQVHGDHRGINKKYRNYDGYPPDWNARRKVVFRRDDRTCKHCGKTDTELHAHHIELLDDGGSHELENLITLCRDCHESRHGFEFSD